MIAAKKTINGEIVIKHFSADDFSTIQRLKSGWVRVEKELSVFTVVPNSDTKKDPETKGIKITRRLLK